jgi:alpha-D-xyloside xylohydrolase
MQYAAERPWDDLEVVVYPGADATFTLYEDEGDNYNYEHGAYATITFQWDNARKMLTIQPCDGQFPGMLTQRQFRVHLVGSSSVQTVGYQGNRVEVAL